MSKNSLILAMVFFISCLFVSCEKDPVIVVTPELITTLNYTLTPTDGGDAIVLIFKDIDGDGGTAPTITGGTLAANQTYNGSLELLNESVSPAEDITDEVKEEDEEHQFFFSSTISDLAIAYRDEDADSNPVGLESQVTTGTASTGTITVTLRHEPNKSGDGVSGGDIANAGGETDIEVTFTIDVQ